MQTEPQFELNELLSLYDMVQRELFNMNCSDFEGCEQSIIKDHLMAAKLLERIIEMRDNNAN